MVGGVLDTERHLGWLRGDAWDSGLLLFLVFLSGLVSGSVFWLRLSLLRKILMDFGGCYLFRSWGREEGEVSGFRFLVRGLFGRRVRLFVIAGERRQTPGEGRCMAVGRFTKRAKVSPCMIEELACRQTVPRHEINGQLVFSLGRIRRAVRSCGRGR